MKKHYSNALAIITLLFFLLNSCGNNPADSGKLELDGLTLISSGTNQYLRGIWGTSKSNIFVVGDLGTILHYDGNRWDSMSSGTSNNLHCIWGLSPTSVFASGDFGTLLQYDGATWNSVDSFTSLSLRHIWAFSENEIYVVGDGGCIFRFDGNIWTRMTSNTANQLKSIYGFRESIHAAIKYQQTALFVVGTTSTIRIYDGVSWKSAGAGPGISVSLEDVWGTTWKNVKAVGNNGQILQFDGSLWSRMSSPSSAFLYGIWGASESNIVAVGAGGTIIHYDGDNWKSISSPTNKNLAAVWGTHQGDVVIAGFDGTIITNF